MKERSPQEFWESSREYLAGLREIPGALACAELLSASRARWGNAVDARTSMFDLLFTVPGDTHPFSGEVRVSYRSGVYEFLFYRPGDDGRGSVLATADRCFSVNAGAVLDAFLLQLVGDP